MTDNNGTEAERLFYGNRGLVHDIINREFPFTNDPSIDRDDLVQIGEMALWNASMNFDPERSRFADYAGRAIRNAIVDQLRDSTQQRPDGTDYAEDGSATYGYDGDLDGFREWLKEIDDDFVEVETEQLENSEVTEDLYAKITDQYGSDVLIALQMKDEIDENTWREIADTLGVASWSSLQNRALKAQKKIKEKYGDQWGKR